MAQVKSIFDISGSVGDLVFYKMNGKTYVRQKPGTSTKKFKQDSAYRKLRERAAIFGSCARLSSRIRGAFQATVPACIDTRSYNRLHKLLWKASSRNANQVENAGVSEFDLSFLEGFNFNSKANLPYSLSNGLITSFSRSSGLLNVMIPEFIPMAEMEFPRAATGFQVVVMAFSVDQDTMQVTIDQAATGFMPRCQMFEEDVLTIRMDVSGNAPIILAAALVFAEEINESYYALQTSKSPCQILNLLK